jgi:hypothetical protein
MLEMINKRMLHLITSTADLLLSFVKDDPVRPEIPKEYRVENNRFIATLVEQEQPLSMVCISLHDFVPKTVGDLDRTSNQPTTVVFYSIWSYQSGAGQRLLRSALAAIKERHPTVSTFVTLSPKTEMARRFHLKNGAVVLSENETTINYDYSVRNG